MRTCRVVLAAGLAMVPEVVAAQIQHRPVSCLVADQFPRFEAAFTPADAVGRARLVFRPRGGRHWYSVAMMPEGGTLAGVLPSPKKSLESLDYYVEVTDRAMATTRTPDQVARVAAGPGACRDAEATSTVASASVTLEVPVGAPSVPPGFNAGGIVGASGTAAGTAVAGASGTATAGAASGGGLGAGVIIGAGVLAAGGAAVAATAGGGEDGPGPTPSPSPSGAPGPTPSPSPSGAPPGGPAVLGLSVSTQMGDQFPVTLQFQGQSITSQGDVTWLEVPMPAAGTYQFAVTPSRAGEVNIGLRNNTPQDGVGVQPSSITPSAAVTRTTPPCGMTVRATGPFTVTFVLAAGQSCSASQ